MKILALGLGLMLAHETLGLCEGSASPVTSQSSSGQCVPGENKTPYLSWNFRIDCMDDCGNIWTSTPPIDDTANGGCSLLPSHTCIPTFEQYNYTNGLYGATNAHPTYVLSGCRKRNWIVNTDANCNCAPSCGSDTGGSLPGGDPDQPEDGEPTDTNNPWGSPIIISLEDSRLRLTDLESGVAFDLNADGRKERMSWTAQGAEEAFLVIDRNQNGQIDDGTELFGDHSPQLPSSEKNGFRALAVFDDPLNGGNGDGWVDSSDPVYEHLGLWVDRNHDGLSQASELSGLAERGVEAVGVEYTRSERRDPQGNWLRYRSRVRHATQGVSHTAWDVFFQLEPNE